MLKVAVSMQEFQKTLLAIRNDVHWHDSGPDDDDDDNDDTILYFYGSALLDPAMRFKAPLPFHPPVSRSQLKFPVRDRAAGRPMTVGNINGEGATYTRPKKCALSWREA